MQLKIYSVRDQKGGFYNAPIFLRSHGEAERWFHGQTNNEKSVIMHHPEDFDLYYVGDFDDQKGAIQPLDTPQHIIKAVELKENRQ